MVTYRPLWHTMIDRGMRKMELAQQVGMSSATLSKLNKDQYVALAVIERICLVLDCPVQDVVEVRKAPDA